MCTVSSGTITIASVWRKLIPERKRFFTGYINDMKKRVGINDWVLTRGTQNI